MKEKGSAMETIRNYLENMFRSLPNTAEVRRAKDELGQMMEDKYTELIEEGMTENAAIGTVISEFGNLDELSETLGISQFLPVKVQETQSSQSSAEGEGYTAGAGHADAAAGQNAPGRGQNDTGAGWNTAGAGWNAAGEGWSTPRKGRGRTRRMAGNASSGSFDGQGRILLQEEVKDFIHDDRRAVMIRALGIFCCIISVCGPIFADGVNSVLRMNILDGIGVALMFVLVAAGVFLIVYAGSTMKKWNYIRKEHCGIDYETAVYLEEMINAEGPRLGMLRWIGIILCILSVVPVTVLSSVGFLGDFFDNLGASIMFIMVGIGVMLIVFASNYHSAARMLLKSNDKNTMGGQYTKMQREEAKYGTRNGILSVFWPTVTCIYLSISFLTFAWHRTWFIWVIAPIIYKVLKMNRRAANEEE